MITLESLETTPLHLFGNSQAIINIGQVNNGSNIYMTLDLVLFDSTTNLNNVRYTEEFIQDIVANKEKYICLPLVADKENLINRRYDYLTHLHDQQSKAFATEQIGSFVDFYTRQVDNVLQLCGTVRIPKRFAKACAALQELYALGRLYFSYEIMVGDYIAGDGIQVVDASPNNQLIGLCVVSEPACPDATAFALVAEKSKATIIPLAETELSNENKEETILDQEKISALETQLAEKETLAAKQTATIAELNASIVQIAEQLSAANAEVEQLSVYKDKLEAIEAEKLAAEQKEKQEELRKKCAAVLDEEEMSGMAAVIEAADEDKVNAILAEKYVRLAAKAAEPSTPTLTTASRISDKVSVQGGLVEKYITLGQ